VILVALCGRSRSAKGGKARMRNERYAEGAAIICRVIDGGPINECSFYGKAGFLHYDTGDI